MKKWLSLLLVFVMLLTLASVTGCKSNIEENSSTSETETETLNQNTNETSSTTSEDTTTSDTENQDTGEETTGNQPDTSSPPEDTTNKPSETTSQKQETGTSSGTTGSDKKPTTQTPETSKPTQDKEDNKKPSDTTSSDTQNTTKPSDTTTSNPSQTTIPTTPAKPSVVTPNSTMISKIKTEFFKLVNEERTKQGKVALTQNSVLNQASDVRAKECFDVFSHTRPNGSLYLSLFEGEFAYNYSAIAENLTLTTNFGDKYVTEENIFVGTDEQLKEIAKIIFTNFKNSAPHYATMMSDDYKEIGIGISTSADTKNNILYISCCNLFGRQ